MTAIILKIILCSSIFIAVYYAFLEKERMYRFNRWYLLSSILLSYIIPFINITIESPEAKIEPQTQIIIEETAQQMIFIQPEQESFNWMNVVWGVYTVITLFLLIKSLLALLAIRRIKGERRTYEHYNIILTGEGLSSFSFWNTIYMGKNYMENNKVDQRIFLHEKAHIDQKHSIDLVILNLLKIFTWFNPVLFLYKKAVITNHEFLADEAVLKKNYSIKEYQNLILEEILSQQNPPLTHSFNFNNTKKRFIMMKTEKSKFSLLKKTAGIATLIAAVVLLSERTYAGNSANIQIPEKIVETPAQTSSQDSYQEFKDILARYSDLLNDGKYAEFSKKISENDKKKLEELYPLLSETQRNEQKITFFALPELKKRIPTENELKSFLNKKDYAVWIDSKKIENSILKNYKKTDFSNVYISKIYPNARTAKNPQPYQVSLMTHPYFEKTKEKEKSSMMMGFKRPDLKKDQDTISPRESIKTENTEGKNTNMQEDKTFVSAEYPNGMKDLRTKIGKTMDVSNLSPVSGTIKATIYVHIDETGKTTNLTASGDNEIFNKELLKTVTEISNNTVWKPATKDGKPIASVLKVPATMTFTKP
ncbi:beta-lactamase regulating signal transducer with metallopeptidase domain [Chryseobacterium vietnamense]|uniref:Beta-lactamase regulating signal transducer with metallopeptidase domain n=1 Tax=Chryseobacterium vietnamense TaxID=866785 RepID=A0ACC6JE79_9FLAO|nr:M56 family metallopeptidase [Chryseobacterium vietnamense]MDR6461097.1 beta-lactamase regulating signal transducer with metallopeptidase domain [Chryseobacterium vietnamense]